MGIFFQLLINGIIAGAIYALVASGFSLVYNTCKFVNFAHGAVEIHRFPVVNCRAYEADNIRFGFTSNSVV